MMWVRFPSGAEKRGDQCRHSKASGALFQAHLQQPDEKHTAGGNATATRGAQEREHDDIDRSIPGETLASCRIRQ